MSDCFGWNLFCSYFTTFFKMNFLMFSIREYNEV